MNIRQYTTADRAALIALWHATFPHDPPHNAPSMMIDAKLAVDDMIFVAESFDEITGACMAGYDGHRGWLYAIAVRQDNRRAGAGSALVKHAMHALQARGCVKVNLQIRAANKAVAAFYESLGFVIEDRLSMGALLK